MEKSGFFNAVISNEGVPDRSYLAEDFADYFATFIGNGIFPNPTTKLQVVAIDNDMQVRIKEGKAWINGYKYENTNDRIFILEPADGVLNRIDRLVLRLDFLKREIRSYIKKGEYNSRANSPSLTRNADMYELALADIQVSAGAIKITQADIIDLRFNKELCGLVHATVDQIDSTVIFNQFQSWYSNKQTEFDKDIDTWTNQKKKEFETWITQNTQSILDKLNNFYNTNNKEFEKWFNALKEKLKGDVATNLLTEISATKEEVKNNKKEIDNLKVNIENTDKKINGIELTAEKVNIKDADNLFSSNNVEGALKEVFINVDNGKKLLRQAIIDKDKSISISSAPTFDDLKNGIKSIDNAAIINSIIKQHENRPRLDKEDNNRFFPLCNLYIAWKRHSISSDIWQNIQMYDLKHGVKSIALYYGTTENFNIANALFDSCYSNSDNMGGYFYIELTHAPKEFGSVAGNLYISKGYIYNSFSSTKYGSYDTLSITRVKGVYRDNVQNGFSLNTEKEIKIKANEMLKDDGSIGGLKYYNLTVKSDILYVYRNSKLYRYDLKNGNFLDKITFTEKNIMAQSGYFIKSDRMILISNDYKFYITDMKLNILKTYDLSTLCCLENFIKIVANPSGSYKLINSSLNQIVFVDNDDNVCVLNPDQYDFYKLFNLND